MRNGTKRLAGACLLLLLVISFTGCRIQSKGDYRASSALTGETVTATLEIRCDSILDHTDKLKENIASLIPEDGILLEAREITAAKNATAFELLLAAAKETELVVDFQGSGSSAYIRAIGGIAEFDCGDLSGWTFSVNGEFPNVGCGSVELEEDDEVVFLYTCDLGRDVRGE